MKITVWGARGSVPVSGPEYVRYGGDTTCVEVETSKGETIIFDGGNGIRPLGNQLVARKRRKSHILLSHAHWDHLLGFPFFKPLYRKDSSLVFHGCRHAQQSVKVFLQKTMRAPFFPVDLAEVAAHLVFKEECPSEIEVADLCVTSMAISHPNNGYGFILHEGRKSFAFFPDNELCFKHPGGMEFGDYARFLRGVDVLVHDAEFLPKEYDKYAHGWGHSTWPDAVRLGLEAGVKRILLWHLNQDRSDEAVDAMLDDARRMAAKAGSDLQVDMGRAGLTIDL
ncbi:MAG: MBL fold metallo-hydrolase [Elusimicrobia bacterium]|nr:MBL fold metallo-hydrolase [Elusimicrobiota bacterium]